MSFPRTGSVPKVASLGVPDIVMFAYPRMSWI